MQLGAAGAWLRVDGLVEGLVEPRHVDAQLFHQVGHQVVVAQNHALEQVEALNRLALVRLRNFHSLVDGFLRFDCELVEVHILFFLSDFRI